jgi:HSP20 family protein
MFDIVTWPKDQWSIFDELESLQDDMSRVFGGGRAWRRRPAYPPANVWLSDDGIIVDVELPGVKADDVDISVVKDELTISGRIGDDADEDARYYRRERPLGEFSRTLYLPFAADADGVTASYKNGVLRITVPRSEETKPKKIAINAA